MQALLDGGAKVALYDSKGASPLHAAAGGAHPEALGALVSAGADVNIADRWVGSARCPACRHMGD